MKKFAETFKNKLDESVFEWGNAEECVLSLSAIKILLDYGLKHNQIEIFNEIAKTGSKKGIKKILAKVPLKAGYSCRWGRKVINGGKTYYIQLLDMDNIIRRDSCLFLESQVEKYFF